MKTIIPTFLLLFSLVSFTEAKPKQYYWVVESTTCFQGSSIIRIYNDQHELVYTENVEGKILDTQDKCVIDRLNRKAKKIRSLREKI